MSLRRRIFLTLCLVVLIGFLSIARWIRGELRNSYSQVVEEMLVDSSSLISAHLENQRMSKESLESLQQMFDRYKSRKLNAPIFDFVKVNPTLDLYITDNKGLVIFSTKNEQVGQNFSMWNDVYRTLQGHYGARSTRIDPEDSRTSVYYVAAPIIIDSKIAGVATISKTESSILIFLDRALRKMFLGGLFSVVALGLIGGLILVWISLPLERLRKYALAVSAGERPTPPQSNVREVKHLSEAFEKMRVSLEGKRTVEKFTQTLTHELKSPLTAIKGAAELCLEEMNQNQRQQFLKNIIAEADRSHLLLEQLLKIAALESKRHLEETAAVDIVEVLNEAKEALMGLWKPKNIQIEVVGTAACRFEGDRFLLFQAFRNILQNSIEFSEPNSSIQIRTADSPTGVQIEITDSGVGIPQFAKERIFEKFYSLERPDTKRKSSGLGLSFVKEVIDLHNGKIAVDSPVSGDRGTSVVAEFPIAFR